MGTLHTLADILLLTGVPVPILKLHANERRTSKSIDAALEASCLAVRDGSHPQARQEGAGSLWVTSVQSRREHGELPFTLSHSQRPDGDRAETHLQAGRNADVCPQHCPRSAPASGTHTPAPVSAPRAQVLVSKPPCDSPKWLQRKQQQRRCVTRLGHVWCWMVSGQQQPQEDGPRQADTRRPA